MEAEVRGLSLKKIFWIFVIGSIFGAFYEEGLYIVRNLIHFGVLASIATLINPNTHNVP